MGAIVEPKNTMMVDFHTCQFYFHLRGRGGIWSDYRDKLFNKSGSMRKSLGSPQEA